MDNFIHFLDFTAAGLLQGQYTQRQAGPLFSFIVRDIGQFQTAAAEVGHNALSSGYAEHHPICR